MARFWERWIPKRSEDEVSSDPTDPVVRNWPLLAAYFLVGLAVAIGVVFGARSVYHHIHNKNPKTPISGNRPGTSKTPAGSSTQTTNPQNQPSPSPGSLPNSGPGNVVVLFVGTSLAATGIHYIYQLRRARS